MHIRVEGTAFARDLDRVAREQFPYAMSLALNRTAQEAVQEKVRDLPRRFTIRNGWVAKGFRVERANKRKLEAAVLHKDPYMYLQEMGGEKRPTSAKVVAVPGPFRGGQGARATIQDTTPKKKWPGRLPRRFAIDHHGVQILYSRSGKRTGRHVPHKPKGQGRTRGPGFRDPGLKLMYVLKSRVKVGARLGLRGTIQQTIARQFGPNLAGFLRHAIGTARR